MLGDTIFAPSSPPGVGERGVLRLSGPAALQAAARLLRTECPARRAAFETELLVAGGSVPCLVLVMPGPASFTGEDTVELHLPGSPLLLDLVERSLLAEQDNGLDVRRAEAGEFTRRAFEHGRIDLAESEAVLQLIHAASEQAAAFATQVLRGGLRQSVDEVRARLLDARALLESGLDFSVEETGAVPREQWLPILLTARAELLEILAAVPESIGGASDLFLVGAANAGKSSLANALAQADSHLVDDVPGTTRDVLPVRLEDAGCAVTLHDGPGDLPDPDELDAASLALRDRLVRQAAGLVLVIDGRQFDGAVDGFLAAVAALARPLVAVVFAKSDLATVAAGSGFDTPVFRTSSVTGAGIAELRQFLFEQASEGPGTHAGRLRSALEDGLAGLDRALSSAAGSDGFEELVALDLQGAVTALDRVSGRSSAEDVLDRIFAGFCLGK